MVQSGMHLMCPTYKTLYEYYSVASYVRIESSVVSAALAFPGGKLHAHGLCKARDVLDNATAPVYP